MRVLHVILGLFSNILKLIALWILIISNFWVLL